MKSPWIAAIFSAFALGAGYLYVGRALRFLAVLTVFAFVWLTLIFGGYLSTFYGFILQILNVVMFLGFTVVDSALIARKTPISTQRWYMKWYLVVAYIIAVPFLIGAARDAYIWYDHTYGAGYGIYYATSDSMAPLLMQTDFVLIDTRYYKKHSPAVGDVVLVHPTNSKQEFIRRVRVATDSSVWVFADNIGKEIRSEELLQNIEVPIIDIIGRPTYVLVSKQPGRAGVEITGDNTGSLLLRRSSPNAGNQ